MSKISAEDLLKRIKKNQENALHEADNEELDQKDEERKHQSRMEIEDTGENEVHTKYPKPSKDKLDEWYGHIKSLEVEIYVIESLIPPLCDKCEAWKSDDFEQRNIVHFHELLGLEENKVQVHIYPCDWNSLHTMEFENESGKIENYPFEMSDMGENYFTAYGMGIGYFPAVALLLRSNKIPESINSKDPEEIIFPGIASKVKRKRKYIFNKKVYWLENEKYEITIIRALLRYLRNLDENVVEHHDKVSFLLGQYHRQSSEYRMM